MLIFHSFKASGSTFFRLHHRLLKSFKEAAISLRHLEKSILEGNLYLGPFNEGVQHTIEKYPDMDTDEAEEVAFDKLEPRYRAEVIDRYQRSLKGDSNLNNKYVLSKRAL